MAQVSVTQPLQLQPLQLKIEGMHCDACVRRVTNALGSVPGVAISHVEVGGAALSYDRTQASASEIAEAVNTIGFNVVEQVTA